MKNQNATLARRQLRMARSLKRATVSARFFKTGVGQYGEGDTFLGLTVPMIRKVVADFSNLSLKETKIFLTSRWHEERLFALLVLVRQYERGDEQTKERIARFYLQNRRYINNWDLVDSSADKILGAHCFENSPAILYKLAKSKIIWDRRIAILGTLFFTRKGHYDQTLRIAGMLLNDKQDLIHKAVGWMLREVGKRSLVAEEKFLRQYASTMPRTMLRYAIEQFPKRKRSFYLQQRTD